MIEFLPKEKRRKQKVKIQIGQYPEITLTIFKKFKTVNDLMDYIMDAYWLKVGKNRRMYGP